jgi:hypothetical protein
MGIASEAATKWAGDEEWADFEVFPENAQALSVFLSMNTQWQWTGGMQSFRCGLNHAVLPLHMDKVGVPRKRRFAVMDDVQVMERSALEVWAKEMASKK